MILLIRITIIIIIITTTTTTTTTIIIIIITTTAMIIIIIFTNFTIFILRHLCPRAPQARAGADAHFTIVATLGHHARSRRADQ
jgi:hypothetical protein